MYMDETLQKRNEQNDILETRATQEVQDAIADIESTEATIAEYTGAEGQELTDQTAEYLVDHAERASDKEAVDKVDIVDTALVEGALEVTGDRPEATENPIVSLEEDGYDDQVVEGVNKLNEKDATLPGGESVAEVVALTVEEHERHKNPALKSEISEEFDTALQYYFNGASKGYIKENTKIDPNEITAHIRSLPKEERDFILEMRRSRKNIHNLGEHSKAENQTSLESEQKAKNLEVLRNSEMGEVLEKAYLGAVELDSRLTDIIIVPLEEDDNRDAVARPSWNKNNESGKHQIMINLNNVTESLGKFEKRMKDIPVNTAKIAQTLGLDPSEVTPELFYVQAMLHEMGHTLEFMDYQEEGKTPEDHKHDRDIERKKLPLERPVTTLEKNRGTIINHWGDLSAQASDKYSKHKQQHVSIGTFDDLVGATADVYRDTKFEHSADKFAAEVLAKQPEIVKYLIS